MRLKLKEALQIKTFQLHSNKEPLTDPHTFRLTLLPYMPQNSTDWTWKHLNPIIPTIFAQNLLGH